MNWFAIAAVAQLSVVALFSMFSRTGRPKTVIVSSILFLALWLVGFDVRSMIRAFPSTPKAEAAMVSRPSKGSCAQVARDMTSAQVQKRLGEPYEKRGDEETRGPGATIWIYRDSRCAVHLFDDKVEFIE